MHENTTIRKYIKQEQGRREIEEDQKVNHRKQKYQMGRDKTTN